MEDAMHDTSTSTDTIRLAPNSAAINIPAINDSTGRFVAFTRERENIRLRREQGLPRPWTTDPILHAYRFCNVKREDDRVTRWISDHWRTPHQDDPDLWFAMAVAWFVNWPDTLAELGYPVPWNPQHFLAAINARKARGEVCFGPAYNISNGGSTTPKAEHLVEKVFAPLWERRKHLRPCEDDSLLYYCGRLKQMPGFESFMAAQVVADMKYMPPLLNARDWQTFAAPGPGSKRGLNRVLGRPVDAPWRDDTVWHHQLILFRTKIEPMFAAVGLELPHAQDLQNMLCEFDKYERAREGRSLKRRYNGS
jgi:hypothetical protein